MEKKLRNKNLDDTLKTRIENLQKMLVEKDYDGALLRYSRDIFYFTGTAQPSYLAVTPYKYQLFVKSGISYALRDCFIEPEKIIGERNLDKIYSRFFSNFPNKKIGIQFDILTAKEYLQLKEIFKNSEFFNVSSMTLSLRSIKDKFEIEQIKKACICAQKGYDAACSILKPGISELELSAAVEYAHRLAGHEGDFFFRKSDFFMSMGPIGSGDNLKEPSGVLYSLTGRGQSASVPIGPSNKRVEAGETIIIDIPCHINGYHCDQTRSFVAGNASSETLECYTVLKQISDYLISEIIRPGLTCADLYQAAIDASIKTKYTRAFLKLKHDEQSKLVGHGIGIELNEPPIIFAGNNQTISENNVLALELHMMDDTAGVLKIEDTIHVGENKNTVLTISPRGLFVSGL